MPRHLPRLPPAKAHADGINIDIEQLSAAEKDNFSEWIKRLVTAFHADHLLVSVDVPLNDDAFDYEYLGEVADAVVVMAYDQHYAAGLPGAIAGNAWHTDGIEELVSQVPPAKLIVALSAYGYDWNLATHEPPTTLSYAEAMILAADVQADVEASGEEMNPTFTYQDDKEQAHEVWLLDAIAAWNQVSIARKQQVHGFSLWRLGMEDPSAWDFLSEPLPEHFDPTRLHMEINITQRVIESITGRGTKLFRAPYDTDTSPTRAAELQPLHSVCQLGFVIADGDIDSCDYQMPGADAIVNNITRALKPDGPNIIVMHDGGGDRHQTLEALRKLIPQLKAQGYEFVSVDRLMTVMEVRP